MDSLILQALVFYIGVRFGVSWSQGTHDFQPIIRNVSMTSHFHRLYLEWDVHNGSKTYGPDTEIVFNIQVNQTEENHIVLNTNYSVPLSELNHSLNWSWDPLVPLQCEPQVIRIRSLVVDKNLPHSETWSDWSPWKAVSGLDTIDDNQDYIFPKYTTLKAGSNFTFCCIARKTDLVHGFYYAENYTNYTERKQRKVLFHLENVSEKDRFVVCHVTDGLNPGTPFFVIEVPGKPKNFACKTEDMVTLECSWKAYEGKRDPSVHKDFCRTELILSDVANTKIYHQKFLDKGGEDKCSFPIENKLIPKLRLTAKNCFGEAYMDYDFYKNHRAPSGQLDIWRDIQSGSDKSNVTIFWKLPPDFNANGKIQAYEIWWETLEGPTVPSYKSVKPEFNSTTIILDDHHSYKISVSAKTLINSSLPSVLIISAPENDHIQVVNSAEKSKLHSTYISWKPENQYDGYIVDWCNYPKSQPCDFQWKRFGENYSSADVESDAFRFNVTYTFRIYGFLNNMTYLLEKKAVYREERSNKDPNETSVKIYDGYDNFFFGSLLLLVIVPIMVIICICFWKSSCIRNHCCSTIPQPDISPFLKQNPGTMMTCDDAPDKLEVVENHQTSTGKQSGLGMFIDNIAYFDPVYHLTLQEREAGSKNLNPAMTSYKPLQDLFANNTPPKSYKPLPDFFAINPASTSYKPLQDVFANNPPSTSYKPLPDFFAISPASASYKPLQVFFAEKPINQPPSQDQGNFNYQSQMELPHSRVQQSEESSSV